jgi:hypothetical protein
MADKKEGAMSRIKKGATRRDAALDAIMSQMPYIEKPKPDAKKVGDK